MSLRSSAFSYVASAVGVLFVATFSAHAADTMIAVPDRNAPHPAVSIGHRENIVAAFASPDGAKIFTTDDKQLRVWDVASRRELSLLRVRKEPSPADWCATFVPEKKWLLTVNDQGFSLSNYETLSNVAGGTIYSARSVVWQAKHQRFYYSSVNAALGEIVEQDGSWKATPMMHLPYENERPPVISRIIPLSNGRLLADLESGYAIVDPVTWKEVARVPGDLRRFERGPAGTLFAFSAQGDTAKPATLVEKLSDTDLSPLGSVVLPFDHASVRSFGPDAFDPDTGTLCLSAGQNLAIVDFRSMALREYLPLKALLPQTPWVSGLIHHAPGNEWFVTSGNHLHVLDLAAKRHVTTLGDDVFQPRILTTKSGGLEFIVGDKHSNVKRVRLTPAGLQVGDFPLAASAFLYTPEGDIVFGNSASSKVSVSTSAQFPKVDYHLSPDNRPSNSPGFLAASPDGSLIVSRAINRLEVISTVDGKVAFEVSLPNIHIPGEKGTVAISPDNRMLVAYAADGNIVGFDLKTRKQIWTKKTPYGIRNGFYFLSPDIFACVSKAAIEYRSADTGDLMLQATIHTYAWDRPHVSAVSHDLKRVAVYDGAYVQVFDAETGEKLMQQWSFAHVTDFEFLGGSRYLVTACEDNLLRIVDIDQRRELCSLALFNNSSDWVASSPDFRFDATQKAIDRMYVVNGATITPLESLFDKLYTPKLLAGLLAGERTAPPVINFSELSPPPSVRLEFSEQARNLAVEDDLPPNTVDRDTVQVHAIAQASRAALRDLRLFQNGKIVSTAGLSGSSGKKSFELTLVPGENVFRAVAANQEGTESRPAEVTITYRPATTTATSAAPAPQPSGLQLHLLIVGVNEYKNPRYNLNYAVADATAVKEKIEAQTKAIFTAVNVRFILDDQALKSSIASAFGELSAKAGPRDVFIFYYAGHGMMTSDAKPEFFLVPHDVTQIYGADDAIRQKGLSSVELQEFARAMPAQKQLFILDACQAAGALTTVAMRGAAEEKAIAQLARSTGTHWLTASGSEQFATEFAQLGHGAFTYALLEGLAGRADTGDGRVTVNELKAFLESEVPEITQKHKGTPQFPSSYGFGQDFPIVVITN